MLSDPILDKLIAARLEHAIAWRDSWQEPHLVNKRDKFAPLIPYPYGISICRETGCIVKMNRITAAELAALYGSGYHGSLMLDHFPDAAAETGRYQSRRITNLQSVIPAKFAPQSGKPVRCLDFGCGTGSLAAALAELPGYTVQGTEFSESSLARARQVYPHIVFTGIQSDVPENAQWDLIVLSHVLEHLYDDAGELRKLKNRLLPGGGIYIEVPLFAKEAIQLRPMWYKQRDHCREYTKRALFDVVRRAGLSVVSYGSGMDREPKEPYQFLFAISSDESPSKHSKGSENSIGENATEAN